MSLRARTSFTGVGASHAGLPTRDGLPPASSADATSPTQSPPFTPKEEAKARALGVTSATGLVIGSIVGTGVFTMPAVLAQAGTMSLAVLGAIAIGAMFLAILFGQLTRRVPKSDGGLYAYARHEFGDFAGYLTGWCYWVQSWAGNAAIVSAWVFYVTALFGWAHPSGMEDWGIALVGLWVPAAVNLGGVRQMAWFQNVSVFLKFTPLLFVGIVGWFFVHSANFGHFNMSGGSLYGGIGIAAGVALFSFIGVEAAAVTAKRVKDPARNVSRASLLGTGASAVLYLLTSAVVMGLVSHHALVSTGSPFVTALRTMFPHEAWAAKFMAAIAVVSGIGALNGWTLLVTETSRAVAQDGLFPKAFAWQDRKHTAWFGIVIGTILPSLLMLWRYETSTGLTVFEYLVDLTVVTVAIPYFMSAIAQLTFLVSRRRPVQGWALARDLLVAGVSVLFSMWVTFASGYQVVYQALVVIMAGLILYAFLNARRTRAAGAPPMVPAADGHPAAGIGARGTPAVAPAVSSSEPVRALRALPTPSAGPAVGPAPIPGVTPAPGLTPASD
jgi:basic amino acid/polyamine antiporter, APA family